MTTYLTKIDGDQHLHYRVTVEENGCRIVQGRFYHWLGRSFAGPRGKGAVEYAKKLIEEKLAEGYKEEVFVKSRANDVDVYDKAKWHYDGNFPKELNIFQGYVHTGMYLGWLLEMDLISDELKEHNHSEIAKFKMQVWTGPEFFQQRCDGVLMISFLSERGNRFSLPYFDLSGKYMDDYEATLVKDLPSIYHVRDTWENYQLLKKVLDKRYSDWLENV